MNCCVSFIMAGPNITGNKWPTLLWKLTGGPEHVQRSKGECISLGPKIWEKENSGLQLASKLTEDNNNFKVSSILSYIKTN